MKKYLWLVLIPWFTCAFVHAASDTYSLTVEAAPSDSTIRIMNIRPRYYPGIKLKPGRYDVYVTRSGYRSYRSWVEIKNQDVTLPVALAKATSQPSSSDEQTKVARQIRITELKVTPVASVACKVSISLRADYAESEIGEEPRLWYMASDYAQVYWFFIPLNDYKVSKNRIVVADKKFELVSSGACVGRYEIKFWIGDNDAKSDYVIISNTFGK
ncbi:hypothetical protein QUF72_14130 [Desulfobacterales bacterium HSG2]|nr:hypothetical protein [Desulfobacterales bacterium HSG2]